MLWKITLKSTQRILWILNLPCDGGKMYGGIKGLFSALKMVYPIFRDSLGEIINVKHEHIKWLI